MKSKVFALRHVRRFVLEKADCEKGGGPVLTVPNDSYSIRELLTKYTQGIDLGLDRVGIFGSEDATHDDYDLMKLAQMDLFEKEEVAIAQRRVYNEALAKLKRAKRAKEEREKPEVSRNVLHHEGGVVDSSKESDKGQGKERRPLGQAPERGDGSDGTSRAKRAEES